LTNQFVDGKIPSGSQTWLGKSTIDMSIVDIFYNQTLLLTIDNSYIVGFIPLLLTIVIVDIFYNQTLLIYS